ncbi:uncharacterized protein [Chelonus insularis]|uniref:uncharacterized protein n=1 Tax=Chelonus insularis TaxID=460826 RepID=UPI00158B9BC1|nr:uncharacterized protein LOC118067578 [Chelonus insularis]
MNTLTLVMIMSFCWMSTWAKTEMNGLNDSEVSPHLGNNPEDIHVRNKRTLFLKKKLLGAGLLGFGLGIAKGYKVGHQHSPDIHHVYVAAPPPPVRYVEYVEKPVFIERIVERPVEKSHIIHDGPWSQPEPSPVYGYP